ncbi:MAG: 23S rRNA (guanosine(2251)-2'-O)-methyltransferase RlmB [Anaerolineales bacterium]|nr:23S rRNA (guanosine(2251)-2'-O)-methyltransferase RlmB [Anaerolineales bacterium]
MTEALYGRNPVYETLRAGRRRVQAVHVARGVEREGRVAEILELAESQGIQVKRVERSELHETVGNAQGVTAATNGYPYAALADLLQATTSGQPPLYLLLDIIQDPQNLGTLLRTAEAVGVTGVILPYRRTATVTPAVVSASSGACEHLLIAQENVARAIEELKQHDVWITGLDADPGATPLPDADLAGAIGLVVGSEGEGMRRLVRESCDFLVRIPMRGRVESLNAAVAGSVMLYSIWAARGYPAP